MTMPIDNALPATNTLLSSVEEMYAKDVVFEGVKLPPNEGGNSTVLKDGIPKVIYDENHPHKEEIIVHELLHLILRKEGYPLFRRTNPLPMWVDANYFGELLTEINEAVLHRVIFHRMQELGFNPMLAMLPLFQHTANADYLNDFSEHAAVTSYMRALLECDDPAIHARYAERYKANNWNQLLVKGRELADYLRPWTTFTPAASAEMFIGCLNLLFRDLLVFTATEWTAGDKRGEHSDQVVPYGVTPAQSKTDDANRTHGS